MRFGLCLFSVVMFGAVALKGDSHTNTYSNPTLGISVTKPKEWHFATLEQHRENLGRAEFKDEEFQKMVQKYSTAPLVVMMKYQEPYDDLNPSFKMNIRPLGNLPEDDPTAIVSIAVAGLRANFPDFKMVIPPGETTVAGQKAGYVKVHYTMEVKDVGKFPVCSELWVVPRGKYFYLMGSGTRQDEKTGKREEIKKIIESIKFKGAPR
jgi:hypothetical protein